MASQKQGSRACQRFLEVFGPISLRIQTHLRFFDGNREKRPVHFRYVKLIQSLFQSIVFHSININLQIFGRNSGGYGDGSYMDLAAKYDGQWSRAGSLMQPRYGHRSLRQGSKIIHVGGYPGE